MSSPVAGESASTRPPGPTSPTQPAQQPQQNVPNHRGIELQELARNSNAASQARVPGQIQRPTTPTTSTTSAPLAPTPPIITVAPPATTVTPRLEVPQAPGTSHGAPPQRPSTSQTNHTQSPLTPTTPATSSASISKPPQQPWQKGLSDFSALIIITLVFIFVSAISFSASSPDWVLARLSPTSGILLLSFMSKITDWGFGGATEKSWEMIQWGPLLRGRGGNLLSFLTLGARLKGWVKVVSSRWAWMPRYGLVRRGIGGPGFWALMRLLIWVVVQFPGIILMSVVEPQLDYLPLNLTTVSGGIGVFDPALATQQIDGPFISNLISSVLQDPGFSTLTDPVTEECRSSPTCISFLMTGGLKTISPYPFLQRNPEFPAYIAEKVPSYQIDAWDLSRIPTRFTSKQCELYTGSPSSVATGFYLCLKDSEDSSIIAAFAPCILDCVPLATLPNVTIEASLWTTKLSIHRRNATFIADRLSGTILSIKETWAPIPQHLTAADFRPALNSFLCAHGSSSKLCEDTAANALLTDYIATFGSLTVLDQFSPAVGVLQNLFATSLYMFTPVFKRQIGVPDGSTIVDQVLKGLPEENYFQGSLAKPYEYVAPAPWTVVAYLVSGVVLLVLCSGAISFSSVVGTPEVSSFPGVDVVRLKVEDRYRVEQRGGMAGVFATQPRDEEVMKVAVGLMVRLDGQGQGVMRVTTPP